MRKLAAQRCSIVLHGLGIAHTSVIGAYAESQGAVLAIITIIEFWGWMFGHVGHVSEQPDGGDEGLPGSSEKPHICGGPMKTTRPTSPSNTVRMTPLLDAHVEDAHDAFADQHGRSRNRLSSGMCAREETIDGCGKREQEE